MSGQYFIGDLHLGHENICKFRDGFTSVEEHDSHLMENIRKCYGKRNSIWLLGDTIFDVKYEDFMVEVCNNFQHVHNVLGNHCTENPIRESMLKRLYGGFDNFHLHGIISKYGFWITHAPIHDAEMRKKVGNIHGHTHRALIDDERYLNVCAENIDYKPVSVDVIRERFN